MPLYEYECKACGKRLERQQHFTDDPVKTCPECGGAVYRLIYPVAIVFIWALSRLPYGVVETSLLADLGRLLTPLGALMGLDWWMMVALLTSCVAKENSTATLGILFGTSEGGAQLTELVGAALTPAAGLAFLTLQMLFIPCAATVAVIKQETGGWKMRLYSIGSTALF
jgi:ferrous iron transport protein B